MNSRKRQRVPVVCTGIVLLCIAAGLASGLEEEKKYVSATSLSALLTAGNIQGMTVSLDTDQTVRLNKDTFSLKAGMIYARNDGRIETEIYTAQFQYNRLIDNRTYLLGLTRFERNPLSGYKARFSLSAGLGTAWVRKDKLRISTEASLGWNAENSVPKAPAGTDPLPPDRSRNFLSGLVSADLSLELSSTARFVHHDNLILNLRDLSAYRLFSSTGLVASISARFALKTSLILQYENRPVPGFKHADLYLLTSIVLNL